MANVVRLGFGSNTDRGLAPSAARGSALDAVFKGALADSFAPGRTVFWEGDRAEHVFKLVDGVLRICRILPDGRRAIVGFAFAGDLLGLSFKNLYLFSAEVVTDAKVVKVTRRQLDTFLAVTPLGSQLLCDHVRDELCAAQDQMAILLHQSAEARLAGFLCLVARRLSGELRAGVEFDLAMYRPEIADHLGLTTETVCRTLTRLKKTGCISLIGPRHVRICEPSRLMKIAKGTEVAAGDRA
jgi:CRP/FNR family transcriptional regulator, anaerobic regulatory protein